MNPGGANSNQRPLSYDDLLRWLVIVALLAILFVQQVQSNLLLPLVMGKQMNLPAVTINFFMFVMSSLFGFLGVCKAGPGNAIALIATHVSTVGEASRFAS